MPVRSCLRSNGPERYIAVKHYWSVVYIEYVLHSPSTGRSGTASIPSVSTTGVHGTRTASIRRVERDEDDRSR